MGFFEDDRIRNKNKHHNEAFELYKGLKSIGYSHQEIIKYAQLALNNINDSYRNNVYKAIILLVRSIEHENKKIT